MIKLILLPFGIKQQKNAIRQAKMKPKEEAIRKKYKGRNDQKTQQKMQNEIMEMYQAEGYNPAGGCLPMLVQLVIIMLLYQVIIYPLRHVVGMDASLVKALTDFSTAAKEAGGLGESMGRYTEISLLGELARLSGDTLTTFKDGFKAFIEANADYQANVTTFMTGLDSALAKGLPNFDLFGMENFLAGVPSFKTAFKSFAGFMLFLIPILNFGTSFASMKLTRKFTYQPMQNEQTNRSMKLMDWFGPLMSLWIAFIAPAALGLYWIFNTVLGVLQQFILYKAMPLPVFTEEDYKAAEAELKGKAPYGKEQSFAEAMPERSLYLEDFDEDEMPAPVTEEEDDDDDGTEGHSSVIEPAKPKDSVSKKKNK